ncbi:MAG: hypothetical protein PVG98_00085 [Chromatiales bacterium]|jgi:hypothetical protein
MALLLAGLLPRAADAGLIQLTATGVLTEITNGLLESQFSLNQPMSVTMTYDADTPAGTSLILRRSPLLGSAATNDRKGGFDRSRAVSCGLSA